MRAHQRVQFVPLANTLVQETHHVDSVDKGSFPTQEVKTAWTQAPAHLATCAPQTLSSIKMLYFQTFSASLISLTSIEKCWLQHVSLFLSPHPVKLNHIYTWELVLCHASPCPDTFDCRLNRWKSLRNLRPDRAAVRRRLPRICRAEAKPATER